jgi:methylmalonyl-CoA mutase, C-terminal domain
VKGRVIVTKIGLDGHTTGAALIAQTLRDAGFEVINLGTHVRPEAVGAVAVQEDVDVVGLSILSGAHVHLTHAVIEALRAHESDARIGVGGTIPEEDAEELRALGADAVFGPGSRLSDIVECVSGLIAERNGTAEPVRQGSGESNGR